MQGFASFCRTNSLALSLAEGSCKGETLQNNSWEIPAWWRTKKEAKENLDPQLRMSGMTG